MLISGNSSKFWTDFSEGMTTRSSSGKGSAFFPFRKKET